MQGVIKVCTKLYQVLGPPSPKMSPPCEHRELLQGPPAPDPEQTPLAVVQGVELPPEPSGSVAPVQSSRAQALRSVWPSVGTTDGPLIA